MMKIVFVLFVALSVANGDFRHCCLEHNVSQGCSKFCDFNLKIEEIRNAFKNGSCNIQQEIFPFTQCTYNFKDATKCCENAAAGKQMDKECYKVCDGSKPLAFDPKLFECPVIQDGFSKCGAQTYQ